jgi:DNA-directed RNA polymerase specialized sigma24 family protein
VAVQPDAAAEEALNEEIRKLLSPREFECMQQRMAGLTYFEVAEVMAVSPGTVASLMSRAARKLRGLLGGRR